MVAQAPEDLEIVRPELEPHPAPITVADATAAAIYVASQRLWTTFQHSCQHFASELPLIFKDI